MIRMKIGNIYNIFNIGLHTNHFMDSLVENVNKYVDELYNMDDKERKFRSFSSKKLKTREQLKIEYDILVEREYIRNKTFEEFFVDEKNKELEYNSVVIYFPQILSHYEEVANSTIVFLEESKNKYHEKEKVLLNSELDEKEKNLEVIKLRFAIQQIEIYINEIKEDIKKRKKIFDADIIDDEKEKNLKEKVLVIDNENNISEVDFELDEKATMKKYKNSGYSVNIFGWYFDPSRNEYAKDYNPLEDTLFQVYKEKKKIISEENYTTDYQKKLDIYHNANEEYELKIQKLIKLFDEAKEQKDKEKIIEIKQVMKKEYTQIKEKYDKIVIYRGEILDKVKSGKLWHPSLSEKDISNLLSKSIRKPQGDKYEEYLRGNGLTIDYINEPLPPIDFYDKIDDVLKIQEKKEKFFDINKILNKIKVFNLNKFKERTIINIPMKLIRGAIGIGAKGIEKIRSKISYLGSKVQVGENENNNFNVEIMHENLLNLHNEMKFCFEKINDKNLSEEEKVEIKNTYERDNELVIEIIKNLKKLEKQNINEKSNITKNNIELLNFDSKLEAEIEESINQNDGLTASELYIYRKLLPDKQKTNNMTI